MSHEELDPATAYYYNTETGEVEQGYVSGWTNRMGPYRTADEAANALAIAAQRNREWDNGDDAWDGGTK